MNIRSLLFLLSLGFVAAEAQDSRKVTVVAMPGLPAGYTTIRVDTLSQCILALPSDSSLQAVTTGREEYLKRILGGAENRHVKVWEAQVKLTFQRQAKLLYVLVPQGGMEKQDPIFRETETSHTVAETIDAQTVDSDFFAFSSPRRFFFDSEAKARESALKRARIHLNELKPLLCPTK
jgi:hypothetical protein